MNCFFFVIPQYQAPQTSEKCLADLTQFMIKRCAGSIGDDDAAVIMSKTKKKLIQHWISLICDFNLGKIIDDDNLNIPLTSSSPPSQTSDDVIQQDKTSSDRLFAEEARNLYLDLIHQTRNTSALLQTAISSIVEHGGEGEVDLLRDARELFISSAEKLHTYILSPSASASSHPSATIYCSDQMALVLSKLMHLGQLCLVQNNTHVTTTTAVRQVEEIMKAYGMFLS